jgi:glycosyltransferase involved in cell wall biosynthesis
MNCSAVATTGIPPSDVKNIRSSLNICIDLRPTQNVHASRGIGTVVRNLVRELGVGQESATLQFLVESERDTPCLTARWNCIPCYRLQGHHQLNWIVNQFLLPRLLKHHAVDLFFATDFQSYIIPPSGVKQVGLAYDLIPFLFPETMAEQPLLIQWGWRFSFRNLRRCRRILAISQSTKRDLVSVLGLNPESIDVAYPGIDHSLFNCRNAQRDIPQKYGISGDYFLYVGDTEWRKNLRGVLQALAGIPAHVKLVIAGKRAPDDPKLRSWLDETGTSERVVLPGFVPDDDLPSLYGRARGFIFPSRYEGFGLPVAEAMACGCPVITSRNSSLPEVAGNAALYVDQERPEEIRDAMLALLQDVELAPSLRTQGVVQVAQFTWERFARKALEIFSEIDGTDNPTHYGRADR